MTRRWVGRYRESVSPEMLPVSGCQSEVVVGGEVQHALAVDDDVPAVVYEGWKVAQVAGRFQLLELLVHEVHISFS